MRDVIGDMADGLVEDSLAEALVAPEIELGLRGVGCLIEPGVEATFELT